MLFYNIFCRIRTTLLATCQQGVALIEFALIAPILFLLVMGTLEFGLILYTQSILEGATNVGSRIGKTGYTAGAGTREDYIRSEVSRLSGGYLDPALLNITILSYDTFDNIGQPEPCINPPAAPCPGTPGVNFVDVNGNGSWDADMGRANAGGRGSIVLYRAEYPWQVFTPLMRNYIGDASGIFTVSAIATVRNEPF